MTISSADTERTTLVDLAADNAAAVWYRLKSPQAYRSVRTVNGHRIVVTIQEADDFAERLHRYTAESDYLAPGPERQRTPRDRDLHE